MENKISVWKANINSGILLGLGYIVFALVLYFLGLILNKGIFYIWIIFEFVLLFIFIKTYRDNFRNGFITYGQSLGAGVVIVLYFSIIAAVFGYILYKFIDPSLVSKSLSIAEQAMIEKGAPESAIEKGLEIQKKIMTPVILNAIDFVYNMFIGTILVLIVSIFTKKEGNPFIDDAIEE